jgi:hypothetical protein
MSVAGSSSASSSARRHIPYLSFHKTIIREICRPQKDDLLILAKGLGMRRVRLSLLEGEMGTLRDRSFVLF